MWPTNCMFDGIRVTTWNKKIPLWGLSQQQTKQHSLTHCLSQFIWTKWSFWSKPNCLLHCFTSTNRLDALPLGPAFFVKARYVSKKFCYPRHPQTTCPIKSMICLKTTSHLLPSSETLLHYKGCFLATIITENPRNIQLKGPPAAQSTMWLHPTQQL